jgi:hypothetical protein
MSTGEIKSSVQLAMERLAAMPRLSAAEVAELERKELIPVAQGLAHKYLDGRLRQDELDRELRKYTEQKAGIVKGALLLALQQAIDLENSQRNERVFSALSAIGTYRYLSDIQQRVEKIVQEYQRRFRAATEPSRLETAGRVTRRPQASAHAKTKASVGRSR